MEGYGTHPEVLKNFCSFLLKRPFPWKQSAPQSKSAKISILAIGSTGKEIYDIVWKSTLSSLSLRFFVREMGLLFQGVCYGQAEPHPKAKNCSHLYGEWVERKKDEGTEKQRLRDMCVWWDFPNQKSATFLCKWLIGKHFQLCRPYSRDWNYSILPSYLESWHRQHIKEWT